jgi:hypothetical protein
VILGVEVVSERADTGAGGTSKHLGGSHDPAFGTVDRYGLFAKQRAQAHVRSIVEVRSPTTW